MTDFQKVMSLFDELGIEYKKMEHENGLSLEMVVDGSKKQSTVRGYNGFASAYMFDSSGKFISLTIWE